MDAKRFDQFSKSLSTTLTRRGLLRLLTVPPLAGSLAVLRPEESRGKKHRCKRCATRSACKANQLCVNRCCKPCTVCSGDACQHSTVQGAIFAAKQGATIRVCPGTYFERLIVSDVGLKLTLVGAGSGEDDEENTILDGTSLSPGATGGVMFISGASSFVARSLRITNGHAAGTTAQGGGIYIEGVTKVTLKNCVVAGNESDDRGGGIFNKGTLTLDHSPVTGNSASDVGDGGGIFNDAGATLTFASSLASENTSDDCAGPGDYFANGGFGCVNGPF
jgi:hypothetical protein